MEELIAFLSVVQMCIVFMLIHDNNKLRRKIKKMETRELSKKLENNS
jgi:hypothetical protein